MKPFMKIYLFFILLIQKYFYKKTIIAIKYVYESKKQNLFLKNLLKTFNKKTSYFAIKIPQALWYGKYNKFVSLTLFFGKERKYTPYSEQLNFCFLPTNFDLSNDLNTGNFDWILQENLAPENLQDIANKILFIYKDSKWADYEDRLQSHHFAGSL